MQQVSYAHWAIVIVSLLSLLAIAYPASRVLKRMGFSRWWTIVAFIPYANVIALWVLSFIRWPADRR
jgi:hypothetical protein